MAISNWLSEKFMSWARALSADSGSGSLSTDSGNGLNGLGKGIASSTRNDSQPGNDTRGRNDRAQRGLYWQDMISLGAGSNAGISVTPASALTSMAVYACVRILSETLASLPLITYKRIGDGGRKRAVDFYLYDLLHDSPNEYMTSFELRETMQGHLATWGNAFAQLTYDEAGRITEIFPLRPDRMIEMDVVNGQRQYKYQQSNGEIRVLPGEIIWHLKAFGDGMWGYSQIDLARNAIGLTLATEKYGSKFFGNGARPGGVLEHPGQLGQEAFDRLRIDWQESHGGLDNAQKVAILEEGMKWHEVGLPPEASQFLETRKFQVSEIARVFRVPPHMIADLDRATFSNIEHMSLEFVNYTMYPWFTRWEQSIKKNLMLPSERKKYYTEFLVDGLLRGDVTSRTAYYATGRQWGWLSANDIREKENMNPIEEGGDLYLTPMNMVPAGELSEQKIESPSTPRTLRNDPQIDAEGEIASLADGSQLTLAMTEPSAIAMTPSLAMTEERARAQAAGRFRLVGRNRKVFETVGKRILRREKNDVGGAAHRMIGSEPMAAFERWLAEFYDKHAGWAAEQMLPHMQAYGQTVAEAVGRELSKEDLDQQVEAFIAQYAADFGSRESVRSYTRLIELIRKNAGLAAPEMIAAIDERLESWVDERSGSIGQEEAVRENNAVAVALYELLGIQRIRSVATGESDCPYCAGLDGMVIGIDKFFLQVGQDYKPEGADTPMSVGGNKRHAPYHDGCDCMVVSG